MQHCHTDLFMFLEFSLKTFEFMKMVELFLHHDIAMDTLAPRVTLILFHQVRALKSKTPEEKLVFYCLGHS